MSQVAINETASPLIGKLVSFWDYDKRGNFIKMYGEVHSSFDDEDSRCEVLHIQLTQESALKAYSGWADIDADKVMVI